MARQGQNQNQLLQRQSFNIRNRIRNTGPRPIELNGEQVAEIVPKTSVINQLFMFQPMSKLDDEDTDAGICILKNDSCSKDGTIFGCYCANHCATFANMKPMHTKTAIKMVPIKYCQSRTIPFLTSIIVADVDKYALFQGVDVGCGESNSEAIKQRFEHLLADFKIVQNDEQFNETINGLSLTKPIYTRQIQKQVHKLMHISIPVIVPNNRLGYYLENNLLNNVIRQYRAGLLAQEQPQQGEEQAVQSPVYEDDVGITLTVDAANATFSIPLLQLNMYDIMQILLYELYSSVQFSYLGNTRIVDHLFIQGHDFISHTYTQHENLIKEEKTFKDHDIKEKLKNKLRSSNIPVLSNIENLTMSVLSTQQCTSAGPITVPIGVYYDNITCHDGYSKQIQLFKNAQYNNSGTIY